MSDVHDVYTNQEQLIRDDREKKKRISSVASVVAYQPFRFGSKENIKIINIKIQSKQILDDDDTNFLLSTCPSTKVAFAFQTYTDFLNVPIFLPFSPLFY